MTRTTLLQRPAATLHACVLAALLLSSSVHAATFEWTAASGQTPDQTGAFTLVTEGTGIATLLPGGPLRLQTPGAAADRLVYVAGGEQLLMHDALVVSFTTRVVDSNAPIGGSLRSPLMVNVSFGNHVGANLMITERFAAFHYGTDLNIAPGAQLDPGLFYQHRLVFNGTTTAGNVKHYVNDILRYSMPLQQGASLFTAEPRIVFGDMTIAFSGTSEWLAFSHNAAPVPEPGSWLLMALGLLAVATHRQNARQVRS